MMDNFDLKKYLAESKLNEAEGTDLNADSEGNKIGRQSYDLLDEYLPKMTTNQRFKLYQTIQNFVTKEKDKY
jgi:hypothetical protein